MVSRSLPLLLAVMTLAACSTEPSAPAPAPDAGDPLEGKTPLQACIDFCVLCDWFSGMGPANEVNCQKECLAEMADVTPACVEKVAANYLCQLNHECDPQKWNPCIPFASAAWNCVYDNGCVGQHVCEPEQNDAGEPTECRCQKFCHNKLYEAKCVPTDAGSHCECFTEPDSGPGPVVIGTCEQLDFACDVWTSCCRKYFDL
jgi:hypothetical protein